MIEDVFALAQPPEADWAEQQIPIDDAESPADESTSSGDDEAFASGPTAGPEVDEADRLEQLAVGPLGEDNYDIRTADDYGSR